MNLGDSGGTLDQLGEEVKERVARDIVGHNCRSLRLEELP
jgi:hypothetical protein